MSKRETVAFVACLVAPVTLGAASFWSWDTMWGINHLAFLERELAIAAGVFLGITGFSFFSSSLNRCFADLLQVTDSWLWGGRRTGPVVLALLGGLAFVALHARTNFLGDGYTLLSFFDQDELLLKKWTEFGSIYLIRYIQSLFGGYSFETALSAFRVMSVVSGMIVLYNVTRIIGRLTSDPTVRILGLASFAFSGGMMLFCGYVEVYPLVWAMTFIFFNLSIGCLQTGRGFWVALFFFLLALLMHLQAVSLLGGLVLLVSLRIAVAKSRDDLGVNVLALAAMILSAAMCATFVLLIDWQDHSHVFVPWSADVSGMPGYTLLSAAHLLDIANEMIVMFPCLVALIVLWTSHGRQIKKDSISWFLGLTSVGSLLFLVFIDPRLGMARDWDLMSLTLVPPFLLLIYQLGQFVPPISARMVVLYSAACLITTGSYVATSVNTGASEDRFYSLIRYYDRKDEAGWGILASYFLNKGDYPRAEQIAEQMRSMDIRAADVSHILGVVGRKSGRVEEAEANLLLALRRKPRNPRIRNELGQIYLGQGRYSEALAMLRQARSEDRSSTPILEGIGLAHVYLGHLDSASRMADTLFLGDSNSAGGHALAMVIALNRGNQGLAREHFEEYLEFGHSRSDYRTLCKRFGYLLTR